MPIYTIVDKDRDPLGSGEINAGDEVSVSEGDVFIIAPSVADDIDFVSASGSPVSFTVEFVQSNSNSFDLKFAENLIPTIEIADNLDLSSVKLDAQDADGTVLNVGDNVTLKEFEGSDVGADFLDIGDGFALDSDLETGGGDDDIRIGANAALNDIDTGDGDDVVVIGAAAALNNLDTGSGDDAVEFGSDGVANDVRMRDGDDTLSFGDNVETNNVDTDDGNDMLTLGDNFTGNDVRAGADDDIVHVGENADVNKLDAGKGTDTLNTQTDLGTLRPIDFETTNPVCFVNGTMIATPDGEVAVERLREGDVICTRDHGAQVLRWAAARRLTAQALREEPRLRPVRVTAGALGRGIPRQDLLVSRQHRVLVRSPIAARMFDSAEVLVPAIKLLGLAGVDIVLPPGGISYHHLLFDRHEIVLSNGAETESLWVGKVAQGALGPAAMEEIALIFPEFAKAGFGIEPARPIVQKGCRVKRLIARHEMNGKSLQAGQAMSS